MPKRRRSSRRTLPKYARKAVKHYDKVRIARAAFRLAGGGRGSLMSKEMYGDTLASANDKQKFVRSLTNFKGNGDYLSDIVKGGFFNKNALIAGAARGIGSFYGGTAGRNLAAGASKWLGFGDYGPTSTNALIDSGGGSQQNASVNSGSSTGDIEFSHTEFVQNVVVTSTAVVGPTAFQLQAFNLNPGIAGTFPFLAQIAQNYTMWEVAGMIFQYKPTSGEFGSAGSNSLGKVVMGTNYDPEAAVFTSSQEMENYVGSCSTKPSCGMLHGVETAGGERLTNLLYVRSGASTTGPAPVGQKARTLTDLGLFQIATEGIFNSVGAVTQQVIGELWVTYRVKLTRPKLSLSIVGSSIPNDNFRFGTDAASIPTGILVKTTNTLGGVLSGPGSSVLQYTFPSNIVAGTYRITIKALCTGAVGGEFLEPSSTPTLCQYALPFRSVFSTTPTLHTTFTSSQMPVGATTVIMYLDVRVNAPGTSSASILFTTSGASFMNASSAATLGFFNVTQVDTTPCLSLL